MATCKLQINIRSVISILSMLVLLGCEPGHDDSIPGVRFTNNSTQNVTVYYSDFGEPLILTEDNSHTMVLKPGEEKDVGFPGIDVHYDYEPKDSVRTHEKADNHIVFLDVEG